MSAIGRKNVKIFRAVVHLVSIYMVNLFFRLQETPKHLLGNQSVFTHITVMISKRMVRTVDRNVSAAFDSSTSPVPVSVTNIFFEVTRLAAFSTMVLVRTALFTDTRSSPVRIRLSCIFSYSPGVIAFTRTIFSRRLPVRPNGKSFLAKLTDLFNLLLSIPARHTFLNIAYGY